MYQETELHSTVHIKIEASILPMYATSFQCSFFFSTSGVKIFSGSFPTSMTTQFVRPASLSAKDCTTGSSSEVSSTT